MSSQNHYYVKANQLLLFFFANGHGCVPSMQRLKGGVGNWENRGISESVGFGNFFFFNVLVQFF